MGLFGKLFGGGKAAEIEPELYNGYRIYVQPAQASGGFRVGARIEKDVDGETLVHDMIRADTYRDMTTAAEASLSKAKMAIDQLGMSLFKPWD